MVYDMFLFTGFHGRWRWRYIGVLLHNFKSSCLVFVLSEGHVTFAMFRWIILSPRFFRHFISTFTVEWFWNYSGRQRMSVCRSIELSRPITHVIMKNLQGAPLCVVWWICSEPRRVTGLKRKRLFEKKLTYHVVTSAITNKTSDAWSVPLFHHSLCV